MNTLISVIIPVYNQEKFIGECLRSVLSQCSEQVEVILVDDGSKDRSAEICREYMARYPADVKLICQENSGSLVSRMNGIAKAAGEYILFVDSDDLLLDNALDTLLAVLSRTRPDMILFNATCDLVSKKAFFSVPLQHEELLTGGERYLVRSLLCGTDSLNNLWTKCIKKKLLKSLRMPKDGRRITNGEDLYQILAMADRAGSFMWLDRVLYYYGVMDNSISRVYNPHYFDSEKTVCTRRLRCAEKWSRDGELIPPARVQTYRIMREITRKVFVSDLPWDKARTEITRFRSDSFYRRTYYHSLAAPDRRDLVLKAPLPLMRAVRTAYRLIKK